MSDFASSTSQQAKDATASVLDKTKDTAASLTEQARDVASDLGATASAYTEQAKDSVVGIAGDMLSSVKSSVETHKSAGADAVAGIARSAQGLADQLESQSPQVAGLVRTAASSVERVSSDIRDRPVSEIVDSVADFAKRQPVAFFGLRHPRRNRAGAAHSRQRRLIIERHEARRS